MIYVSEIFILPHCKLQLVSVVNNVLKIFCQTSVSAKQIKQINVFVLQILVVLVQFCLAAWIKLLFNDFID
jgi:hypothetical protein